MSGFSGFSIFSPITAIRATTFSIVIPVRKMIIRGTRRKMKQNAISSLLKIVRLAHPYCVNAEVASGASEGWRFKRCLNLGGYSWGDEVCELEKKLGKWND